MIGGGPAGVSAALVLGRCRRRVLVCDSRRYRNAATRAMGIPIHREPIERFQEQEDGSAQILLNGGKVLNRRAIFFNTDRHQPADFAKRLGCSEFGPRECELKGTSGRTSIPGLYIIGDASRDTLQVVAAAGEGSQAAIAINVELLGDDGVLI